VLPQGSGKSVVIAHFAKQLNQPILIFQPSKELLEQNVEKLAQYVDNEEIGIYSASMNSKTVSKYTFATIGTAYKNPDAFKHFKTVIIDECSLVNPENNSTMYRKLLKYLDAKLYGLTATPFRMSVRYEKVGLRGYADTIHTTKVITRIPKSIWRRVTFTQHISDLQELGYLSPLEYHDYSQVKWETIPLNKTHSDFDLVQYEQLLGDKMESVVAKLQDIVSKHHSIIVFCTSVRQANDLSRVFTNSTAISAQTPPKERKQAISDFKNGKINVVFNVNILSYGFDHPKIDAIVLLRPTKSLGWYMQALGRGMRVAEGKTHCDVYDFSGNSNFFGRADSMKMKKDETDRINN
jgi:DNA repair protein RadD